MQKVFDSINWIVLAITAPLSIIIGAIANPAGAVNSFLCRAIDLVASVFPSTPPNLKIATLLTSAGDSIPIVGRAVVYDIFSTIAIMFAVVLIIKVYKLIPFKMS
jgi:hypothetical protein